MPFLKLFFYLAVLILVLALAYYTTRLLGSGALGRQQTKNMRILDRMQVGRDSSLLVVQIQDRILLMGVSPAGIAKLEELEFYTQQNQTAAPDFAAVFKEQMKHHLPQGGKQKKSGSDDL